MTTAHDHLSDEALSALLDGDPGADPPAHLAACPECTDRFDQLGDARAVLGRPPAGLDELTRRRLVTAAVAAAGEPERRRTPFGRRFTMVAAAAVAVMTVGSVVVLQSEERPGDMAATQLAGDVPSQGRAESDSDSGYAVVALGDLTEPGALKEAVETAIQDGPGPAAGQTTGGSLEAAEPTQRSAGSRSGVPAGGGGSGDSSTGGDSSAGGVESSPEAGADQSPADSADSDSDSGDDGSSESPASQGEAVKPTAREQQATAATPAPDPVWAAQRCIADTVPAESVVLLAGIGTYGNEPVVAVAFRPDEDGRILALVLAQDDCTVLYSESFG